MFIYFKFSNSAQLFNITFFPNTDSDPEGYIIEKNRISDTGLVWWLTIIYFLSGYHCFYCTYCVKFRIKQPKMSVASSEQDDQPVQGKNGKLL